MHCLLTLTVFRLYFLCSGGFLSSKLIAPLTLKVGGLSTFAVLNFVVIFYSGQCSIFSFTPSTPQVLRNIERSTLYVRCCAWRGVKHCRLHHR
jgi:hypothetical protein